MAETRDYPETIHAGHLGGGRRIWKPELLDATEAAHTCEYARADIHARLTAENERLREALQRIAAGDGVYGAQAGEYKSIARTALLAETMEPCPMCDGNGLERGHLDEPCPNCAGEGTDPARETEK